MVGRIHSSTLGCVLKNSPAFKTPPADTLALETYVIKSTSVVEEVVGDAIPATMC
jgi:hypothetical protein